MYQPVQDAISVAGVFSSGKFNPRKFLWNKREYFVEEITLESKVKDGGVRQQFYSVLSGGTLYRLRYTLDSQEWQLSEVWYEG